MSTTAGVSLDEYLSAHYDPECELIAGELVSKVMGSENHGDMQSSLIVALRRITKGTRFKASTEVSFLQGNDVRIPDVSVYRRDSRLYRGILDEPPILCVEIVSPSQSAGEMFAKCDTYHAWGVPYCWVIDPSKQAAWEYHASLPPDRVLLTLRAGDFEVFLSELFE